MTAKSTHGTFLDCDQRLMGFDQIQNHRLIKWFGKARIGDGRGNPIGSQTLGCGQNLAQSGTKR